MNNDTLLLMAKEASRRFCLEFPGATGSTVTTNVYVAVRTVVCQQGRYRKAYHFHTLLS